MVNSILKICGIWEGQVLAPCTMMAPLAKSQPLSRPPSVPLSVGGLTKPIKYVPVRVGEIAAALQSLPKQLPIPSDIVRVGPPTLLKI